MKTVLIAALALVVGAVVGWNWASHVPPRFDLGGGSGLLQPAFVIDHRTGHIWRYYRNMENGQLTSEGFTPVFAPTDSR